MPGLLIKHVLVNQTDRHDVSIDDGKIVAIGPGLEPPADCQVIDGAGKVLLPGFVDAHSHLDKSLLGRPWYPYQPRSMEQVLRDERSLRSATDWDYETQIGRNAEVMIANGGTHTRAFVDVDTDVGLKGLEGMLAVREKYSYALSMQIIAFAQSGIAGRPGTEQLLDDALARGADAVGGMDPCSFERDPIAHLDLVFEFAERHGSGVDIHLHERAELGAFSAGLIIDRTKALDLSGRVVISHPDFLGGLPTDQAMRIVERLADAGIAVTTCVPSGDPKPPLKAMLAAGLVVGVGCDGQRDSWGPFNRSDMLLKAYLLAWRYGFGTDEDLAIALDLVTKGGARVMGLPDHEVRVGATADLVLLPGAVMVEPVVGLPAARTVIKNGRVVADGGRLIKDSGRM